MRITLDGTHALTGPSSEREGGWLVPTLDIPIDPTRATRTSIDVACVTVGWTGGLQEVVEEVVVGPCHLRLAVARGRWWRR